MGGQVYRDDYLKHWKQLKDKIQNKPSTKLKIHKIHKRL